MARSLKSSAMVKLESALKVKMCNSGGKMIAKAELLNAPTKEMKLSSCGIPIAKAPRNEDNECRFSKCEYS